MTDTRDVEGHNSYQDSKAKDEPGDKSDSSYPGTSPHNHPIGSLRLPTHQAQHPLPPVPAPSVLDVGLGSHTTTIITITCAVINLIVTTQPFQQYQIGASHTLYLSSLISSAYLLWAIKARRRAGKYTKLLETYEKARMRSMLENCRSAIKLITGQGGSNAAFTQICRFLAGDISDVEFTTAYGVWFVQGSYTQERRGNGGGVDQGDGGEGNGEGR
jgi:hypothetical protein